MANIVINACQDWVKTMAPYSLAARLLNEHGRVMEPAQGLIRMGPMGMCYQNSYQGMQSEGLTYVEGYALKPGLIPLDHAWLVDKDGKAIDPTWSDGECYFGVPFKHEFVEKLAFMTGIYGILGSLYRLRDLGTVEDVYQFLISGVKED